MTHCKLIKLDTACNDFNLHFRAPNPHCDYMFLCRAFNIKLCCNANSTMRPLISDITKRGGCECVREEGPDGWNALWHKTSSLLYSFHFAGWFCKTSGRYLHNNNSWSLFIIEAMGEGGAGQRSRQENTQNARLLTHSSFSTFSSLRQREGHKPASTPHPHPPHTYTHPDVSCFWWQRRHFLSFCLCLLKPSIMEVALCNSHILKKARFF